MEISFAKLAMIFLSAAITQNILLSRFFGMCSFIAVSKSMKTATGLGFAVLFVTVSTAILNYLIYQHLLAPLELISLRPLIFIMVIAGFVQLVEMIIERFSPTLHINLGIYLPLITVNCAILGVNETMINDESLKNIVEVITFAFASGAGWFFAICIMAAIRKRLENSNIPKPLRGLGITMMITGLMALAFMGFAGTVEVGV